MSRIRHGHQRSAVALAALTCLLISALPLRADKIIIDDFNNSNYQTFAATDYATLIKQQPATSGTPGTILGGERDTLVEIDKAHGDMTPISANGVIGHDPDMDEGMLQLGTWGQPGTKVTVQYDGVDTADSATLGLQNSYALAAHFDDSPNKGFYFNFLQSDGGDARGLDIRIVATNPNGGTMSYYGYVPNSKDGNASEYFAPFKDFQRSSPSASFDNVNSLTISFNTDGVNGVNVPDPNVDFALNSISADVQAVPEPSMVALLGTGVAAVVARQVYRRRYPRTSGKAV